MKDEFKLHPRTESSFVDLDITNKDEAIQYLTSLNECLFMDNAFPSETCICKTKNADKVGKFNFKYLFNKDCAVHTVKGSEGKLYNRMFHGTELNNLESLLSGLDPKLGSGQMGEGFYVTPNMNAANTLAKFKTIESKNNANKSGLILEILVPQDFILKQHRKECHCTDDTCKHSTSKDEALIEQLVQKGLPSVKFIIKSAAALNKLILLRGHTIRYNTSPF